MNDYRLVTLWRTTAPQQEVFDAISDSMTWPDWWPGAERVIQVEEGAGNGVGSVRRYVWKGYLPYRLGFDARATRVDAPRLLEACVSGDLAGTGRWTFSSDQGITSVRYEWRVHTTKPWMNRLAPLTRAAFVHNHHALMKRGAAGLMRRLDARLVGALYGELPYAPENLPVLPQESGHRARERIDWPAAAGAGVAAGVVATAVQIFLWWSASYPVLDTLLRDSRLAAAIVLGNAVLPVNAAFNWTIMLTATVIHFALSAIYGLLGAPLFARLPRFAGALVGAILGLALYGINMYGFTALFPWFEASRDWITATAHVVFGLTAALGYQALAIRKRLKWQALHNWPA